MSDGDKPTRSAFPGQEAQDIFVVGAPRSGTTWLQRLIGSHPMVASLQETFFFSTYLAPLAAQYRKHSAHLDEIRDELSTTGASTDRVKGLATVLSEADMTEWMRDGWMLVRQRALELKPGSRVVAEKSPPHAGHVALLRRVSPGCRVVHIVRDPRRAARSSQRAPWSSGSGAELLRSSRRWQQLVRKAREAGEQESGYFELRYEALVADTAGELEQVFRFLHLDATSAEIDALVAKVSERTRTDSSELVLGGHARQIGLEPVEPEGFDLRSRSAHSELSSYEEWLVLKNAPVASELGYCRRSQPSRLTDAAFTVRSVPVRLAERLRIRRSTG